MMNSTAFVYEVEQQVGQIFTRVILFNIILIYKTFQTEKGRLVQGQGGCGKPSTEPKHHNSQHACCPIEGSAIFKVD